MNEITGALVCMSGGMTGAMFALPFRGVKNWRCESYRTRLALSSGLVLLTLDIALVAVAKGL